MSGKSEAKILITDTTISKECSKCHEIKLLSDFYRSRGRNFLGTTSICKICFNKINKENYKLNRERNIKRATDFSLKSKYNLTSEEVKELYNSQEGKCLICKNFFEKLVIDHNHLTNKVRGMLCSSCNITIGIVKEDIEILKNMIEYIKEKN